MKRAITWLAIPSLVAFGVLSWLPLSYYRMVGWPWMVLWQVGGLALLGWGMGRLRQFGQPVYALGHGLDGWMAATGLTLVLASLFAPFPRVALWNASLAITYGLGLYAYRNWVDQGWLTRHRLWGGLVTVAAGVAVLSLVLWHPDPAMWQSQNFLTAIRNHQPLGHHNFVGGYLTLTLPLTATAAVATQGWRRWLGGIAAGSILTALYISGSRGAALGLVVWLGATWLGGFLRVSKQQRWRWGFSGLGGLVIVALVLATNPRIRGWFSVSPGAGITDGPTLDRWFMLRLGGNILRHRPLLGVGPGVMSRVSNLYRPIETGAGLDHIQQLHNTPLQLAGELGLAGLVLYLIWVWLIGRLWVRLWRQPLVPTDRALLGGIGGGLLAYGVSSLTDYQLENIPIAGTLLGLVVLLVVLGDAYGLPRVTWPFPRRRGASLAVWTWIGLLVYIWLPFTLTVAFGAMADGAFYQQKLNLADSRWHKASLLSPWDPTAAAVASEALWELDQVLGESEAEDNVRSLLLDYAQQAQRAAPNDAWFNQNLAVLYQAQAPAQALPFAANAVQLMPRNRNFGYWLLGELLLSTGQPQPATTAFVLEALVNPDSLTYPLWQAAPLRTIYPVVVQQTLATYDQLLTQVGPNAPGFAPLYEARVLLGWWTGQPMEPVEPSKLRPIVQSLLLADTDPEAALKQVEATLAVGPDTTDLRLLAAWLDPKKHWSAYANHPEVAAQVNVLRTEPTLSERALRAWLTARAASPSESQRGAMAFAYRNYQARQITLMLAPQDVQIYPLIIDLGLFQPWPREFPPLDHAIETLRTRALGLPHPTHNGFRLSSLSPLSNPNG